MPFSRLWDFGCICYKAQTLQKRLDAFKQCCLGHTVWSHFAICYGTSRSDSGRSVTHHRTTPESSDYVSLDISQIQTLDRLDSLAYGPPKDSKCPSGRQRTTWLQTTVCSLILDKLKIVVHGSPSWKWLRSNSGLALDNDDVTRLFASTSICHPIDLHTIQCNITVVAPGTSSLTNSETTLFDPLETSGGVWSSADTVVRSSNYDDVTTYRIKAE